MKVKKDNRVLNISEPEKDFYLSEGYDVVEFDSATKDYKVVEAATGGRTYSVNEYNALLEENKKLKKQLASQESNENGKNLSEYESLKQEASDLGIDFKGNASKEELKSLIADAKK